VTNRVSSAHSLFDYRVRLRIKTLRLRGEAKVAPVLKIYKKQKSTDIPGDRNGVKLSLDSDTNSEDSRIDLFMRSFFCWRLATPFPRGGIRCWLRGSVEGLGQPALAVLLGVQGYA
jgi:hypothetical protein